ncbi:hypothetical protein RclHR1_10110002 [Rhizophagus clarus]|uniref:CigA protein n=1 Tax=Rhizophagus clarus TaxID=94130 RepID=A0A2Z6Q0S0_9GLOM|nr:hypothetical protein RclHR1_10110002 [Rhizophagus clarus]GES88704.1 CigA protein [Rhizophagus clarus]
MVYGEQRQRQLQESLLPSHQKEYCDEEDIPKTTIIGWLKNYFRGHVLPSMRKNLVIIILFIICLFVLLSSQHNSNEENTNKSDDSLIIEENYKYFPSNSKFEKFMTYLPHGDIFQQRDELENAVMLAHSTNRTLIIPPIILGLNIEFINYKSLLKKLNSLGNNNKSECIIKTIIPEQKETKYEIDVNCLNNIVSYSLLRWDSLFNLNYIKKNIHILHRKDFDQVKLEKMLNITNSINDVYEISLVEKNRINLDFIRSRNEKLVTFDNLSRIDLISKEQSVFWNQLNSSFKLNNPVILDVSNNIIKKLGGMKNYVGVHAKLLSTYHSRKLIKDSFSNLTSTLKENLNNDNMCIYLVTDLDRNDQILTSFLSKFPCVKMLNDFNETLFPLLELYNPSDGTFLFKFFEPLVDSIIASNGMKLFTIDDSIYSKYAKKLYDDTSEI